MSSLSIADYIVFVAVLVCSSGIGLYYRFTGGKQSTLQEYMFANRSMSPWPVAFSLMASFMSAVTLLGVSSEHYVYGTQFLVINLSYVIGTPIVCYVFLPVFYNRGGASAYEYLEQRFGKATRTAASIAFTLQMVLYNGIVLYAPSLALSAVTGLDRLGSVLAIGFVCTFYSTIGGMKAVLITDVFQSILMFAAVYVVIIHGIVNIGFTEILKRANEGGRIEFFNFDLDPTVRHTVWTQIFGGLFVFLSLYAVNQAQVQRLLTVKDIETSRRSLWISLPILIVLSISTAFAGLVIYANYQGCDPLSEKRICGVDQLLPLYVIENLSEYQGVPGLFIAGILSGSLSTLSSSINSLAAVTLEDYIKPLLKSAPSNTWTSVLTKLLVLSYGMLAVGFSFVAGQLSGVLQASLTVFGVVGGPLLGLFSLGMLFPFTSQKSSLPAFIISLALGLWIGFGQPKPPTPKLSVSLDDCSNDKIIYSECSTNSTKKLHSFSTSENNDEYFYLYRLSYMWYTLIGFSVTILIGCLGSLAYPETKKLDSSLLSPIIKRMFVKLPKSRSNSEINLNTIDSPEPVREANGTRLNVDML